MIQIKPIKLLKSFALPMGVAFIAFAFGLSSAQVQASDLSASPSWVSFGRIAIGRSTSSTVYIRNNSNQDANSVNVSSWGDTSVIKVDDFGCFSIRAHNSCSIYIQYAPREVGHDRVNIRVDGRAAGSLSIDVDADAYDPDPTHPPLN